MDVGRDHVGATVNTLVLAYVGAALPVLLIFASGALSAGEALNLELVAEHSKYGDLLVTMLLWGNRRQHGVAATSP